LAITIEKAIYIVITTAGIQYRNRSIRKKEIISTAANQGIYSSAGEYSIIAVSAIQQIAAVPAIQGVGTDAAY
jgi:hypothetical protein